MQRSQSSIVMTGRQAKFWKSQEDLIELGHINEEMKPDDQLRIKIALKVMRKAHIHGSRSERDREKMRRETNIENLTAKKRNGQNKPRPKSADHNANVAITDPHEYKLNLYTAVDMFKVKSFAEIEHEAKACSLLKRERKKLENQSSRFGHMRQIFPALIEEIKEEFALKEQALLDRRHHHRPSSAMTAGNEGNIPFSSFYSHGKPKAAVAVAVTDSGDLGEKKEQRTRPSLRLSIIEDSHFAKQFGQDEHVADNNQEQQHLHGQQQQMTPLTIRPSTAGSIPLHPVRPASASLRRFNSVLFDPATTDSNHNIAHVATMPSTPNALLHKAWPNTPTFAHPTAKADEKIIKVLLAKEQQEASRDIELKKKIQDREDSYQMRLEARRRQSQQKAWLSLLAFLTRAKLIKQQIEIQRKEKTWMNQSSIQKRAMLLIKRWWRNQSFRRRMRSHPMSIAVLRRCIAVLAIRVRLRRKQRSASLIIEFLRCSDSLSTSMKKIYAFRQSVINLQRWFRSWLDVQIFRTRLLWTNLETGETKDRS
jgi:hypothetical protein